MNITILVIWAMLNCPKESKKSDTPPRTVFTPPAMAVITPAIALPIAFIILANASNAGAANLNAAPIPIIAPTNSANTGAAAPTAGAALASAVTNPAIPCPNPLKNAAIPDPTAFIILPIDESSFTIPSLKNLEILSK